MWTLKIVRYKSGNSAIRGIWLSIIWSLLLAACASATTRPTPVAHGNTVPFETIVQSEDGSFLNTPFSKPKLLLLDSVEAANSLQDELSSDVWERLQQVDFERHVVIAAFQGWQGSSGYHVSIRQVSLQQNRLVVHTQFWSPSPHQVKSAVEIHPVHMVGVARTDLPQGEIELVYQSVPMVAEGIVWVFQSRIMTPMPPKASAIDIPFETIIHSDDAGCMRGPDLLLLTSLEDATVLEEELNPIEWRQLQQVDFDRYHVMAAFQGRWPGDNHNVIIKRITRTGNQLTVHTQFWYPNPYWRATTEWTCPRHFVKVAADDLPAGEVALV